MDFYNKVDSIEMRYEQDAELKQKDPTLPGRRVLFLSGLDCADCARKIEDEVSLMDGVKLASLDFVSQKLTIDAFDRHTLPAISRQAAKIANRVDAGVRVSLTGKKPEKEKSDTSKDLLNRVCLCCGVALFVFALLFDKQRPLSFYLYLLSYLFVGGEVLLSAGRNILKGQIFDENFLMSVATIGAFAIGKYPEGVAVMLFYQIGQFFQRLAVNRSRRSIYTLMDIRPDFANLLSGGQIKKVPPEEVGIGDHIIVKPGEKIPLDGKVLNGRSTIDASALTGESLPRDAEPGSEVFSGSINLSGALTIEVSMEFGESTVSKILDLVQNASSKKAPTENFITKFARYYTPIVVFSALALALIPPLFIPSHPFAMWIYRALVFLVVSCPCALVISIPLSFFGGIGGASKNGILIKGSNHLEALNNVDTVVFDKTGTLTKGIFEVARVVCRGTLTREELLHYAACAESYSNHPIALSIQKASGEKIDKTEITEHEETSGLGISVKALGRSVLAGSVRLMEKWGIPYEKTVEAGTVVHLAVDGIYAGYIVISDEIKSDSSRTIAELKGAGIKNIVMLTGDSRTVAAKIAAQAGIDTFYAELLPGQKVEMLEMLENTKTTGGKILFVGDGINDAPVLARADIGVAMGALGSDAAIEAADVVLMTDEPSKIVTAIGIAKKTHRSVWQNIIFALCVKAVILVFGAFGLATMWEAVFGDVGVTIIAVLNAMRAMRVQR
jgi:Cd2+/Zn2+-exporting ATPase